jgi:two-component system LytT family response regulator
MEIALAPLKRTIVTAGSGREALAHLLERDFALVLLDVQMPEMDGFDVVRALPDNVRPYVVFVTAYDTFAVRAFEAHAIDYLVKPVHEGRFNDAVARARERLRTDRAARRADALAALLAQHDARAAAIRPPQPAPRLVIATGGTDLVVSPDEITWIEADDYYAAIHALGRRHLVRESLASLEERLDGTGFVRVHRSAIVNLGHVREIRSPASGDPAVVLRNGTELPLSRRRREAVAAALRRFTNGPA